MGRACDYCGKPVADSRAKYCSHACAGAARQNYKACVICGKRFPCPPSNEVSTCDKVCSKRLRQQQAEIYGHAKRIVKESKKHAETTPPEQWQTAKDWVLQAPDGTKYECRNLINFFREHPELIDCSPETAARGIVAIKSTLTGARKKHKSYQWRGWLLLDWDDRDINPRKKY